MTDYSLHNLLTTITLTTLTIVIYQVFSWLHKRLGLIWLNPMLLSILAIIPFILFIEIPFEQYFSATKPLSQLLEPAVIALGFPLYQHLTSIKNQWKSIILILSFGAILVISISFFITIYIIPIPEIAVSLSLKSITTPIAIALANDLNGNSSITAFAIILAGLFGALLGPSWLKLINVHSAKAQGLAIGAASHVLGTATISKISYEHAAYGSLALILSAVITAIISPFIIPLLFNILL